MAIGSMAKKLAAGYAFPCTPCNQSFILLILASCLLSRSNSAMATCTKGIFWTMTFREREHAPTPTEADTSEASRCGRRHCSALSASACHTDGFMHCNMRFICITSYVVVCQFSVALTCTCRAACVTDRAACSGRTAECAFALLLPAFCTLHAPMLAPALSLIIPRIFTTQSSNQKIRSGLTSCLPSADTTAHGTTTNRKNPKQRRRLSRQKGSKTAFS